MRAATGPFGGGAEPYVAPPPIDLWGPSSRQNAIHLLTDGARRTEAVRTEAKGEHPTTPHSPMPPHRRRCVPVTATATWLKVLHRIGTAIGTSDDVMDFRRQGDAVLPLAGPTRGFRLEHCIPNPSPRHAVTPLGARAAVPIGPVAASLGLPVCQAHTLPARLAIPTVHDAAAARGAARSLRC